MKNEINVIETKINELAKAIIPSEGLESFNAMSLQDRVFGIKFFASMAKDQNIIDLCEYAEQVIA